jgi:hypothetical protein
MTLGCGGYGGNITSDNISPRHLLNIKRLAYELTPVALTQRPPADEWPSAPKAALPIGISADALTNRIDQFLGSRGYKGRVSPKAAEPLPPTPAGQTPLDFVCEDDVRHAIETGRKLVIAERAIVTPAARELGEQHRVFATVPWGG